MLYIRFTVVPKKEFLYLVICTIHSQVELSDKIKEFIAPIKQHIEADGGSVEFIEVTEDLIVKIKLSGSVKPCEDCPDPMKYCTPCIMDTRHLQSEIRRHLTESFSELNGIEYD